MSSTFEEQVYHDKTERICGDHEYSDQYMVSSINITDLFHKMTIVSSLWDLCLVDLAKFLQTALNKCIFLYFCINNDNLDVNGLFSFQ